MLRTYLFVKAGKGLRVKGKSSVLTCGQDGQLTVRRTPAYPCPPLCKETLEVMTEQEEVVIFFIVGYNY